MKEKKILYIRSYKTLFIRIIWNVIYYLFFRFSPLYLSAYRRFILRLFGAKIDAKVRIYPSVKIWLPSNLKIKRGSAIGPNVNLYNQGKIQILENVIISQNSHLCTGTHDYKSKNPKLPHYTKNIKIKSNAWICADAFIGPGVEVGQGSIVGARSVVFKDTKNNGIYVGNPAKLIKKRIYRYAKDRDS